MKFYNREKEIKLLTEIQQAAEENAQMTTLMGRRRIGKTIEKKQWLPKSNGTGRTSKWMF